MEVDITIKNILIVPQEEIGVQFTKKGTVRKRKPKEKKQYFTQDTEDAIIAYLAETDPIKRNKIYNDRIDYSFFKLTNWLNELSSISLISFLVNSRYISLFKR